MKKINQVIKWLEKELDQPDEELTDNTEDIVAGRSELAKALLKYIKGENE